MVVYLERDDKAMFVMPGVQIRNSARTMDGASHRPE
jgi:hypothetical protein